MQNDATERGFVLVEYLLSDSEEPGAVSGTTMVRTHEMDSGYSTKSVTAVSALNYSQTPA
jgi:hypothetical protein